MVRVLIIGVSMCMILLIACSEDKTPIASVSHEVGWNEPGSEVFHAQTVVLNGAISCRSCHGENVDSDADETFCQDCHKDHPNASYPHRRDWNIIGDPDNHGNYMKQNQDADCNSCHGRGDTSPAKPCSRCHAN